ncbi:MAG: LAGLIDADG family homing endonuclease [Candidatus Bathyarchaeia archaeon]
MSFRAERIRKAFTGLRTRLGRLAQRIVPEDVSRRQLETEIPESWRADSVLWDYVYKGLLKVRGSGAGFVVPPYTAYWERLWGTTPIEDLPKYKDLYTFTPYIKAAIDVTVNLAISNGFELEGGEDEVREWLTNWLDEQNILQTLRIVATDMLVFGNAYLEICRDEQTGAIAWLKPLDPVHMRVRRDAYGNIFGYIQLLTFPPVVFEAKDIVHFKWGAKSWWYECFPTGTAVYMGHNVKPIEKMNVGDDVITHVGRTGKVEAVKSFDYNGDLIEITTYHNNEPILATPTHPIYASIRKRGTKHKEFLAPSFVPAEKLAVKDYLLIPINREVVDVENIRIEANKRGYGKTLTVDSDFMRLCGYYLADGSRGSQYRFYIVFNKYEKAFAEDAKRIAERNQCHAFIQEKHNKIYVIITSTALTKFMEENFGRGAENKHIPKWAMLLPPEKQWGMIEGLIRGDGYRDEKRFSFSTISPVLAKQVFNILLRQNVIPSFYKKKTHPTKLKDGRVIHPSPFIYTVSVYNRKDWSKGWGYAKGKIVGDYAFLPIKKIRRVPYKGKIWNLDINGDETFCVGVGYAVHNSAYGTSLLRPLLKIQALIDQLEDDMAIIVHTYTKPMLVVKAGTPERPFTDQQLRQLVEAFRDRKPATDVFVRGDVDVEVVPSLTKDVNITWWLDYLYTQREAVLGVPKIFMGKSEGTNRACYSEDTYVLTEDGWKLHPEVGDRKIAVYDPETDSIKFEKPIKLFAYDYQGEMYHFKSRSGVDILVTPEHKMLYKTYESPKWRIDKAEELPKRVILKGAANFEDEKLVETFTLPSVEIKTAHNKVLKVECEKSIKMDDWLEFVGYFLSEGGLSVEWKGKPNYVLTLAQKDRKKAEKISDCLKRCGLSYTEYIDGNLVRWNVYGKQVWMWLKENCGAKHYEKHVPREFLNLPKKQLAILFNALMLGNGTRDRRPNRTNMTYYTTSKTLAEDVQVIALKLGYFAHIITSVDKRAKRKPVYRVLINNAKDKVVKEIKQVAYKGKVYCFQTSTGFYVTMRNGKPTIQGNTAEVVMQEYVTRLRMMQEIIGDQLETCLFKQLIKDEFGEGVEIPKVKWRPIWEPTFQDKARVLGDLVDKGIILPKEARVQLGFPEEYPITTPEELQAVLRRNGVKP